MRSLVLALLLLPALAGAAERFHASLSYERGAGAEECPDESTIRRSVAVRLGYEPWSDTAPRRLTVRVVAESPGWAASIELTDADGRVKGRRRLTSATADCHDLAESLQLALGLALDPLLLTRPPPDPEPAPPPEPLVIVLPPPEPPAPPEPPPMPEPVPEPVPEPEPVVVAEPPPPPPPPPAPPPVPVQIALEAGASWVKGLEPTSSWGGGGAVNVRRGAFAIAARLRADQPQSMEIPDGMVRGAAVLVRLEPCLRVDPFAVCVVGGIARLRFTSDRRSDAMDAIRSVGVVGPRIAWNIALGERFALFFAADATVLTGTVVLRDAGATRPWWSTGAFDVSVSAGLSWRLASL